MTDTLIVDGPPIAKKELDDDRWYFHPKTGEEYISVTTVNGMTDSKPWLKDWAARYAATYAVENTRAWGQVRAQAKAKGEDGDQAAIKAICAVAKQQRDLKADLGSFWHDVVEGLFVDKALPAIPEHLDGRLVDWGGELTLIDQAWLDKVSDGFLQFVVDFDVQVVAAEATVASDEHKAAGTLDMMVRLGALPGCPLALIDTKSGLHLGREIFAQLGALNEFPFMWLRNGLIVRKPRAEMWGVLHLRPEYQRGYKLKPVTADEIAGGWADWLAGLAKVRAREALPKRFGHALYPALPDGSQPPPMIEDLYSYPGCSRAVRPLIAAGFETLEQVALLEARDVQAIKGVGKVTVAKLGEVLAEFGLAYAAEMAVA